MWLRKHQKKKDHTNVYRAIHYVNCIIFTHIPKINSISTSLNIYKAILLKPTAFCIKS